MDTEKELERERVLRQPQCQTRGGSHWELQPQDTKDNVGNWYYYRWTDELEKLRDCQGSLDSGRLSRNFYSKATSVSQNTTFLEEICCAPPLVLCANIFALNMS